MGHSGGTPCCICVGPVFPTQFSGRQLDTISKELGEVSTRQGKVDEALQLVGVRPVHKRLQRSRRRDRLFVRRDLYFAKIGVERACIRHTQSKEVWTHLLLHPPTVEWLVRFYRSNDGRPRIWHNFTQTHTKKTTRAARATPRLCSSCQCADSHKQFCMREMMNSPRNDPPQKKCQFVSARSGSFV